MRNLLYAATAITALALTPAAHATVMSITFSESGVPTFTTPTSTTGAISVGPIAYGSFPVNQVSGQDQSALAIPGILNSNSINIAGSFTGGIMTVDVKSTGLTGIGEALGLSSFAVNSLNNGNPNGAITSITEITKINGVTLATKTFTAIGTDIQNNLVDLGTSGTFTAEDIFVITSVAGVGNANLTIDLSGTPVPEPASLALLGIGVLGVGFVANRKRSV